MVEKPDASDGLEILLVAVVQSPGLQTLSHAKAYAELPPAVDVSVSKGLAAGQARPTQSARHVSGVLIRHEPKAGDIVLEEHHVQDGHKHATPSGCRQPESQALKKSTKQQRA